jgi:3-dehydroquinate synthase
MNQLQKTSMPDSILIRSAMGDYQVDFWEDLSQALELIDQCASPLIVIDRNVARLYHDHLHTLEKRYPTLLVDALETTKTIDGVASLVTWLQENGANKKSTLIAIGGGIIQDLCAFTAHTYYRGIDWMFFPTTLLSMCDSCIGAKCGINHNQYKNQVGVFHAPKRIAIVPKFLDTLDIKDVASGYGEILKLMLTGKVADFELLETSIEKAHGELLGSHLPALIHRSLEIKRGVVEKDEYETDLRRILNYGHTFGHALETLSHYEVPHGLAVAWGVDLINYIGMRKGVLSEAWALRVRHFILRHLVFEMTFTPEAYSLIEGTKKDKKAEKGLVNLILLHDSPFELKVVPQAYGDELNTWVKDYLNLPHAFSRR